MKSYFILILFLFCISFLSPNDYSEPKELLYSKGARDKFYPIGWSETGNFAYIKFYIIEGGCGYCPFYEIFIQSLVTDKILFQKSVNALGAENKLISFSDLWKENYQEFKIELNKNKIIQPKKFNSKDDLKFKNDGYNYNLEIKFDRIEHVFEWYGDAIKEEVINNLNVILECSELGSKSIYRYTKDVYPTLVNAYISLRLISPIEQRLAIVLVEWDIDFESGGNRAETFKIIGAHLTKGFNWDY